jgi:phosphate transport system ATP-binding protein
MVSSSVKLSTNNFNFWYGSQHTLHDINLEFATGAVSAIIGPSGCGKSTLLRSINRMHDLYPNNHYQGQITLHPHNINLVDTRINARIVRQHIGMVFQKPNPFPKSIWENVAYGLKVQGISNKKELNIKVQMALESAALWDEVQHDLNKNAQSLSGGQQQRLCIARALAPQPDIILFDEPTSALDPIATARIENLIMQMNNKVTVIIVTHNMQQAARISNQTVFMYMGKVVEMGETSKIFTNPTNKQTQDYITGRFG